MSGSLLTRILLAPRNAMWSLQRRMDLKYLWPACKQLAENPDEAKAAFAGHAFTDPCWIGHYGEQGLIDFINTLD